MVATAEFAIPKPIQGESHADFVVRAHRELISAIPDPDERNQEVWKSWYSANGSVEEQRADRKFSSVEFEKKPNVCYFTEHEATSRDDQGNPVVRRYTASKLGEIVGENNFRIANVDAYPTVIDRHTAAPGTVGPDPETIGAIGPLRLGMVGRIEPVFAIFGDEYIRKDQSHIAKKKPGRSVEVLTLRANGRSYINPVAAISEAPRLPLPLQFSFGAATDDFIERYSFEAPAAPVAALPGGGNTHVDKFDSQSPGGDVQNQNQEAVSMLQEQDVRQIVDAIMSTDQMQWVTQQMQGGGTPAGGAPPQASQASQAGAQDQFGMGGNYQGAMRFGAQDQDDIHVERQDLPEQYDAERYAALVEGQKSMANDLAEANSRLAILEVERADAVRSSRLNELASRLPIDIQAESEKCLYSAGSTMDDDEFDRHISTVEQYAARAIERVDPIPEGVTRSIPGEGRETAQYQAKLSNAVRALTNHYANRGEVKTYHELKAEAEQQLSNASA